MFNCSHRLRRYKGGSSKLRSTIDLDRSQLMELLEPGKGLSHADER